MKNTIKTKKNAVATSKQLGDFGDFGDCASGAPLPPATIAAGITDQNQQRWIKVAQGQYACWLKITDLAGGAAGATAVLAAHGIILLSSKSLHSLAARAEAWQEYKQTQVMTRPGWWGGDYLHGSGTFISAKPPLIDPLISMSKIEKFVCKGTAKSWMRTFIPFLKGQDVLLVALGFGLLAPLLDVLHGTSLAIANPVIDWCGGSSSGKTTCAIKLPGSLWGHLHGSEVGFGETWLATVGGYILMIEHHNGSFFGLDEAHLASDDPRQRAKIIANVIHIIEKGKPKTTQPSGLVQHTSDLVCVSTSNDLLATLLRVSADSQGSIAARLLTFHVPKDRPYGMLKVVPSKFNSSGEAIDAINAAITRHHGASSLQFMKEMVKMRSLDHDRLISIIQRKSEEMLTALEIDPSDGIARRRAKPYALAYAATHLGRLWGVLPKMDAVGSYKAAFVEIWKWTIPSAQTSIHVSPQERLRDYSTTNHAHFKKASANRVVSNADFQASKGYLHRSKNGTTELIMAPSRFKAVFNFNTAELAAPAKAGVLVGERGKTIRHDTKRTVRNNRHGDAIKDRVFVIRLDRL